MRIRLSEAEETPLQGVPVAALDGPHVGPHGYTPPRLMVLRDGEETPAGGVQSHGDAARLHVLMAFLPEELRGQGLGTRLLARIKAQARAAASAPIPTRRAGGRAPSTRSRATAGSEPCPTARPGDPAIS